MWLRCILAAVWLSGAASAAAGDFASLQPAAQPAGYLARLLINEAPFPGERGYVSEEDSKATMLSILWVLHSRIHHVPEGYSQEEIAAIRTQNIIDVITAKGQCEGFSKGPDGKPATDARVEARIQNLLRIANSGGKPGRFASLLLHAQGLASAYLKEDIQGADRYAGLAMVNRIPVTGRAYSWMTGMDYYHPGGNFVKIPDAQQGVLGGNRFYTLRKEPQ
ncbi:MAG TPA: hypothetical protein PK388_06815 [Kiritimatiellia bacterium]|nr:hypothetical protein [Kiritimatiellia bacterium]